MVWPRCPVCPSRRAAHRMLPVEYLFDWIQITMFLAVVVGGNNFSSRRILRSECYSKAFIQRFESCQIQELKMAPIDWYLHSAVSGCTPYQLIWSDVYSSDDELHSSINKFFLCYLYKKGLLGLRFLRAGLPHPLTVQSNGSQKELAGRATRSAQSPFILHFLRLLRSYPLLHPL